jgi:hypothetical protein
MTLRERLIVWADNKPWMGRLYVAGATRRDKKLAATEFDKVIGSGLGTLRRKDGSVITGPVRDTITPPPADWSL